MRAHKLGKPAWVATALVALAAGGVFALVGVGRSNSTTAALHSPAQTGAQAPQAAGRSAVLPPPPGWSSGPR